MTNPSVADMNRIVWVLNNYPGIARDIATMPPRHWAAKHLVSVPYATELRNRFEAAGLATHRQPHTTEAAHDVRDERDRQDVRWGIQNHPDGTGTVTEAEVDRARKLADTNTTWASVLFEEVLEALASQPGSRELRSELVQVAAVAQAWIEALDRRAVGGPPPNPHPQRLA